MAPRHKNFRESSIEKLRYALLDNRALIGLVVTFFAIGGLIAAAVLWANRQTALPAKQEQGEIVRFGISEVARGRPERPVIVVVRTEDGRVQTLSTRGEALSYCHVGDRIRLVRHGRILAMTSRACAPPV
jgi:hypothetical protein